MAVSIGDEAPDFVLETTRNETFRLSSLRGRKVVLFFYPADESIGCTVQVCGLRDVYEELVGHGAEVVGINGADAESPQRFAGHRALPFPIASDPDDAVRRHYGAFSWRLPGRVTYLIDEQGVVRDVFSAMLRPREHVKRTRRWVEAQSGAKPTRTGDR